MLPDPLHPAVVHFPVVLAVAAPVFALGALWVIRRSAKPARAWGLAVAILGALAISSWVATRTGEAQEDRVERVMLSERPLHGHEEAAESFLVASVVVLVLGGVGFARGTVGRVARLAATGGAVALVVMGWNVGRTGGELVYRHGAASAYTVTPVRVTMSDTLRAEQSPATPRDSRQP